MRWVDMFTMSDEEIVGIVLKEPRFFGHIIERCEAKLDRYIRRLGVLDSEDRADVMQEIFIKVYKNLNSFDTSLSFSSWVYRIGHTEAISWYSNRSVRPEGHLISESEDVLRMISAGDQESEITFDESINAEEVERALEEIDQKYKDVLLLRYFEHKEYSEISDILKIPTGSVGTLIHRGKQQLQKQLNRNVLSI